MSMRDRYDEAWSSKLDEIRERHSNDLIPYEAHDAGLQAVAEFARDEAITEAVRLLADRNASAVILNAVSAL